MKWKFYTSIFLFFTLLTGHAQMTLSGTATGDCDCYTLTTTGNQAGSIWSPTTINLTNPFDFTFHVYLGASDGGADGIVFVLRQTGTSTGGLGSLLGYSGITNSVGVEIDTWNSDPLIAPGDIVEDHVGMSANGAVDHGLQSAVAIDNIEDAAFHVFNVVWDPTGMEMTVTLDGTELFTYTGDIVATYFGGDPNVYFGWTGSTGGASNIQQVCMYRHPDFTYEPFEPCPGQEINFTSTSTSDLNYGDTIYSWDWVFEPGATSILENPSYTFDAGGDVDVTLSITDISGCAYDTTITIEIGSLSPIITESSDVTCFGADDGTATAFGGEMGVEYTYSWDDPLGQTTATATDLPPGTYIVTVTSEFGCVGYNYVIITQPTALNFGAITTYPSTCDGATGGFVLSGTGGTPGYEYSVNGGSFSTETAYSDLPGGEYIVVIRDENGCTTEDTVTIETEGLSLSYIFNNPSCYGFSDGSITINVEGAGDGITFEITNEDGTLLNEDNSNTANTLGEGWYYFYVEDEVGCAKLDSVFLDAPDQLDIDLTLSDVVCFGDPSGWARVDSVYNAQGDYTQVAYFWTPNPGGVAGIGADSTFNLGAGAYTLTINDENGCSRVFDFEIEQPDSMYFIEFGAQPAYCRLYGYQSGNGVVFGSAVGGTPDFDYLWTNLDNGNTSVNSTWGGLNPGTYQLTATDGNGCILQETIYLDSLNPEAIFTVVSAQLNADCQGNAPVEVEFHNNSINFANPNNPDADTVGFWNLNTPEGNWFITNDINEVIDTVYASRGESYTADVCLVMLNKNGCSDTTCKTITVYEDFVIVGINIFSPNNDGINDVFTFEYKTAAIAEFKCVIVNRWGIVVGEINAINESWDGKDKNGDPCIDGVYFYTYEAVTDNSVKLSGQGTLQIVGSK